MGMREGCLRRRVRRSNKRTLTTVTSTLVLHIHTEIALYFKAMNGNGPEFRGGRPSACEGPAFTDVWHEDGNLGACTVAIYDYYTLLLSPPPPYSTGFTTVIRDPSPPCFQTEENTKLSCSREKLG